LLFIRLRGERTAILPVEGAGSQEQGAGKKGVGIRERGHPPSCLASFGSLLLISFPGLPD